MSACPPPHFAGLELERLVVLYPGSKPYALADRVEVLPLTVLADSGAAEASRGR